jgi:hypothetical protein
MFWTDTQLRISCHQLKIETGRYQGTLLHDRKCECCSSWEVEDEYHFLIHCNKLENDRNLLLKEIAKSCPKFKGQTCLVKKDHSSLL